MKRFTSLIIVVLLVHFQSFGQQEACFRLLGGLNLATAKISVDGFGSQTPDRAAKLVIGFSGQSKPDGIISFGYEFLYSQMGYEPEKTSLVNKITLKYIAFPLLVKFWLNETINLHIGLEPSILYGGNRINGFPPATSGLKAYDFAAAIGVEVFLSKHFGIGGRFAPGIINISDVDGAELKNNSIRLFAIIRIKSEKNMTN